MSAIFVNKNWETKERTRCSIYTRVLGYHRPVTFFSEGKKAEFYSRTCFTEKDSANSKFIRQFA